MTQQRVLAGVGVAVALCAAVASFAQTPPGSAALPIEMVRPHRGDIDRHVKFPGIVRPLQQATLYAKVGGYLKSIRVDKGDSVEAGQLLAELEVPELIADLARNQAEAEVARTDYNRMRVAAEKAPDLVMPMDLDQARGKYEIAKANLERIRTLLSYTKITAPFSGTITARYVDLGAFVPAATSGSAAQTSGVVTLMDFDAVRVQVAVPESEASRVASGQAVRFDVEAFPGRVFEASITRYSYALNESSKTMLAEIEMPNPGAELRPGMYASLQIAIERHKDVLLVPLDAVLFEKGNASAFTVAGGKAKKMPLKVGFNDGANVEIIEGLNADQPVIRIRNRNLADGQAVQAAADTEGARTTNAASPAR
jgi:RND family efflux transporter MFP subunit